MRTKRSVEGYVLIDHQNSPGITPEFVRANKLDAPAVGAGQTFESAITVCHVCGGDVILNPNRSRERTYCLIHDAYTCDNCTTAVRTKGRCTPLKQIIAEAYEKILCGNLLTN